MDSREINNELSKLEDTISTLINEFSKKTETDVEIDMHKVYVFGTSYPVAYCVELKAILRGRSF